MRRVHSPATDRPDRARGAGHGVSSLDGVVALQRLAGNRAVAGIARAADVQTPPKPKEEDVAVTFPGVGVVHATAVVPEDRYIGYMSELSFHTAHPSPDSDTLYKVLEQTRASGKKFDVELAAGTRRLTIKQAQLTSYGMTGGDASGQTVAVVNWALSFTATEKPFPLPPAQGI